VNENSVSTLSSCNAMHCHWRGFNTFTSSCVFKYWLQIGFLQVQWRCKFCAISHHVLEGICWINYWFTNDSSAFGLSHSLSDSASVSVAHKRQPGHIKWATANLLVTYPAARTQFDESYSAWGSGSVQSCDHEWLSVPQWHKIQVPSHHATCQWLSGCKSHEPQRLAPAPTWTRKTQQWHSSHQKKGALQGACFEKFERDYIIAEIWLGKTMPNFRVRVIKTAFELIAWFQSRWYLVEIPCSSRLYLQVNRCAWTVTVTMTESPPGTSRCTGWLDSVYRSMCDTLPWHCHIQDWTHWVLVTPWPHEASRPGKKIVATCKSQTLNGQDWPGAELGHSRTQAAGPGGEGNEPA
jgi:hypothetical protein